MNLEVEKDYLKVREIFKIMGVENVPVTCRRTGPKDQGPQKRPRYITLEFNNSNDKFKVKNVTEKLKANDETKNFYMKPDRTKKEREEYKRLYKEKERLENDESDNVVEIKYGKLYVDGVVVDKLETENSNFL